MTRRRALVCACIVPPSARRRRVMLAVSPPLLGELIARQLDHNAIEVVVDSASGALRSDPERFDVLVTSGPPPSTVNAGTVVMLARHDAHRTPGTLLTVAGREPVTVHEIAEVVALIDALALEGPGSTGDA